MRLRFNTILFFSLLLSTVNLKSQSYQQWTADLSSNNPYYVGNIVVDEDENSYLYYQDSLLTSLIKLNNDGQLVWRVDSLPFGLFATGGQHDGLYYSKGALYYLSNNGITKFDTNGNLIWQWQCAALFYYTPVAPHLVFDAQNNLLVAWCNTLYSHDVAKIDQHGDSVWQHSYCYIANGDTFLPRTFAIASDDSSNAYFEYSFSYSGNPVTRVSFIKCDKQGQVLWSNSNKTDSSAIDMYLEPRVNGELYAISREPFKSVDSVFVFDTSGNLKSAKSCNSFFTPFYNNGLTHYYWSNSNNPIGGFIIETDSDFNVLASYQISNCDLTQVIWNKGEIYAIGVMLDSTNRVAVTHLSKSLQLIETLLPSARDTAQGYAPTCGIDSLRNFYLLCSHWGYSATLHKYCFGCKPNITGRVYNDADHNCQLDSGEFYIPFRVVELTPGPFYAVSDIYGNFSFLVPPGNYRLTQIIPAYWNANCQDTIPILLDSIITNSVGNLLGSYPTNGITDLKITMTTGEAVFGYSQHITLVYSNGGTTIGNGWVSVNIDSSFFFIQSSPPPDSVNGNSFFWKYSNLQPQQSSEIDITDSVPVNNYAFYIYQHTCYISPIIVDTNTANNYDTLNNYVVGSFDPNEKSCSVKNVTPSGNLTDSSVLIYTIAFQNTGNDTARKIVVVDTLDLNLDISTFTMLQSSIKSYHLCFLGQDILEWTFDNALLPDSSANLAMSQAFVKYSISPKQNLVPGTIILNSAAIYFDFNPGVFTNTTVNYFERAPTTVNEPTMFDQSISLYPNPMNTMAKIVLSAPTGTPIVCSIFDLSGRLIASENFGDDRSMILKRNAIEQGLYLIELNQQNHGIGMIKVVVQ